MPPDVAAASGAAPEPIEEPVVEEAVTDHDSFLAALSIECRSNTWHDKATGRPVGRLHRIGRHWKATCRLHASCVCYLSVPALPGSDLEAQRDLLQWLDDASQQGCAHEQHQEASTRLKRDKYHMRVRTR